MKKLRYIITTGLAALLMAAAPTASRADLVYGVTLFGGDLISIDTTTGAGNLVGTLAPTMLPFGLASAGGNLYTFDASASLIRQIDPATGGTQASVDIGIGSVVGQGGLAFENSTVGFLTSALDPVTFNPVNNLYRFDLSTGTSTLIAHTTATLEAIAFGPGGVLYALDKLDSNLYILDPTTGGLTLVGNTGVSVGSPTGGLAFGPGGVLYATLDDKLYTLSLVDGTATAVGSTDPADFTGFSSISGLAFAPSVPEPSSLVILGMGVVGIVAIRSGRHRFAGA